MLTCLFFFFQTADEDGTYNSFQYWRVPLPELDHSLLDEFSDHYPKKDKFKENDTTADAMETWRWWTLDVFYYLSKQILLIHVP